MPSRPPRPTPDPTVDPLGLLGKVILHVPNRLFLIVPPPNVPNFPMHHPGYCAQYDRNRDAYAIFSGTSHDARKARTTPADKKVLLSINRHLTAFLFEQLFLIHKKKLKATLATGAYHVSLDPLDDEKMQQAYAKFLMGMGTSPVEKPRVS